MSRTRIHPENPLLIESEYQGKKVYYYWCEGCGNHDCFDDTWTIEKWNPLTISPSVRMSVGGHGSGQPERTVCHVFIKNGVIEYLNDCPHKLRGQKVPMTAPKLQYFNVESPK